MHILLDSQNLIADFPQVFNLNQFICNQRSVGSLLFINEILELLFGLSKVQPQLPAHESRTPDSWGITIHGIMFQAPTQGIWGCCVKNHNSRWWQHQKFFFFFLFPLSLYVGIVCLVISTLHLPLNKFYINPDFWCRFSIIMMEFHQNFD